MLLALLAMNRGPESSRVAFPAKVRGADARNGTFVLPDAQLDCLHLVTAITDILPALSAYQV